MRTKIWIAACVVGVQFLSTLALSQEAAKSTAPVKGEAVLSSVSVSGTVTKIDHKTRQVTVKGPDGKETSFVATADVKNLDQVKKGDVITATYTEALVYNVTKGTQATGAQMTAGVATAEPGAKPAMAAAQQTTVTVTIAAIDRAASTITFKGGAGTRTIKVVHPEKLEGVNVGDTVNVTYTEALAIKVSPTPTKK